MKSEHPTGEIVTIDAKGNVYRIHQFVEEGMQRYALADGKLVIRKGEDMFQITGTPIILQTSVAPQNHSLSNVVPKAKQSPS